jgi:thiol-disulfide isomerase/thioredoxin
MRRTRRRWTAIGVALGLTLAACSTGTDAVSPGSTFSFVAPGGKTRIFYDPPIARGVSPDMSGDDLLRPGTRIGLSDYSGKVVVLNIWGSWCGPCRAEMPELQRVYEHSKGSGVTLLGIDVRDDTRSAPQDFIRNIGVTYPSIYDPPGRSLLALRGYPRNIVPSTIVLDRRHRVAAVFLMALLAGDLQPVVDRLDAESPWPASPSDRGAAS